MKMKLLNVLIFLSILSSLAFSQGNALRQVERGMTFFYEANFEEAIAHLDRAIRSDSLSKEELFDANVYLGFALLRKGEDLAHARPYFIRAIKLKPGVTLDALRTPPDLYQIFEQTRQAILGNLYVISDPMQSFVSVIDTTGQVFLQKETPALFENLTSDLYYVVVNKNGFNEYSTVFELKPNMTDTIAVFLLEKQKSFLNRWWTWGGGVAVATALLLIDFGGNQESPKEKEELPVPPKRPE